MGLVIQANTSGALDTFMPAHSITGVFLFGGLDAIVDTVIRRI